MADDIRDAAEDASPETHSSDDFGIIAAEVYTGLIAVLASIVTFYPMDTLLLNVLSLKLLTLILIANLWFATIAIAIERKRLIGVDRAARIVRETAQTQIETDRYAEQREDFRAIRTQVDTLEGIIRSDKPDREKVESASRYIVVARAFTLVEEITRYLENNQLPRPRKAPPWILAAGGSIPPEQRPEATMARAFRAQFGNRLRALVEQFKENGIKLPQKDEAYFDPHTYSWVRLAIDQIKEAANRLASNLEQANEPDEM